MLLNLSAYARILIIILIFADTKNLVILSLPLLLSCCRQQLRSRYGAGVLLSGEYFEALKKFITSLGAHAVRKTDCRP